MNPASVLLNVALLGVIFGVRSSGCRNVLRFPHTESEKFSVKTGSSDVSARSH